MGGRLCARGGRLCARNVARRQHQLLERGPAPAHLLPEGPVHHRLLGDAQGVAQRPAVWASLAQHLLQLVQAPPLQRHAHRLLPVAGLQEQRPGGKMRRQAWLASCVAGRVSGMEGAAGAGLRADRTWQHAPSMRSTMATSRASMDTSSP